VVLLIQRRTKNIKAVINELLKLLKKEEPALIAIIMPMPEREPRTIDVIRSEGVTILKRKKSLKFWIKLLFFIFSNLEMKFGILDSLEDEYVILINHSV